MSTARRSSTEGSGGGSTAGSPAGAGRAREVSGRLGWRRDAEFASGDDLRVIQFTPPGSGCSVIFGKNVTAAAPGSAHGLYLIVSATEAIRQALLSPGRPTAP